MMESTDDDGERNSKNREHRKHRHRELRKKKTRHKQGSKMKPGSHHRREHLERLGLLSPDEDINQALQRNEGSFVQGPLFSLSPPGRNVSYNAEKPMSTSLNNDLSLEHSAEPLEGTMSGEPDSVNIKTTLKKFEKMVVPLLMHEHHMKNNISGKTALANNLGTHASYDGDNKWSKVTFLENKQPSLPGINMYLGHSVSLRHHGKLAVSKTLALMVNKSRGIMDTASEIQNMVQALPYDYNSANKDLSLGNSSVISLGGMIDEATRVKNTTGSTLIPKDHTDKRPTFLSEAVEGGNRSWPLHQHPSSLETALEKQKALATNIWSARCAQKPARRFTYHRVTSSPQVQRLRQQSAFVVVSVATVPEVRRPGSTTPPPLVALPDKVIPLLHERQDPLEQQLADLSAHRDMPWSHTRHLNSIQDQQRSLSSMEQKLQYRGLDKQRLQQVLRNGGKERAVSFGSGEGDIARTAVGASKKSEQV